MSLSPSPPTPPHDDSKGSSTQPATAYHSVHFPEGDDDDHHHSDSFAIIATAPSHLPQQPTALSVGDAMITLIKGNLGPGILNLPHAFALAGYGLGSILFLLVSFQGLYSMWLLVACQERLGQGQLTFMGVARTVLGPWGGRAVEVFLFVSQGGVCCVFLSLLSTHIQTVFHLAPLLSVSIVTVVLLGLVLLRWIADLVWLSTVANVCMVLALGTASGMGVWRALHSKSTLVAARLAPAVMTTFTTDMFYALEGIGLVLPVANAYNTTTTTTGTTTTTPQKVPFGRVLLQSMGIVATAFIVTGLCAAAGFPDNHSGSITEYLQATFPHTPWFGIVNGLVMLAVGMTFPLQLTPAAEVMETWVAQVKMGQRQPVAQDEPDGVMGHGPATVGVSEEDESIPATNTTSAEESSSHNNDEDEIVQAIGTNAAAGKGWIIQRWSMVLFFATIVVAVDDLGVLMSLFGAVGQTTLAAMPCVIHLAMQYQGLAPLCWWQSLLNGCIVIFCLMVMISGCVQCLRELL